MSEKKSDIQAEIIGTYETDTQQKPRRISSLDATRGVAMIFILLLHYALAWADHPSVFLAGAGQIFLEFLGPAMFIVLSTISVVFTIKRKKGVVPEKVIRNNIYMRGGMIILIALLYNLFSSNIWGWNILMLIGFSQIFTYYALKLSKIPRIIVGLIILFSSEIIRETIWIYQDVNILLAVLNFIISSPAPEVTVLPWLSVCFLAPVFGEYIYEAMIKGTEEAYRRLFKLYLRWGFIFVIIGIIFGLELKNASDPVYFAAYPYLELVNIWNRQGFLYMWGIPKFLLTGTATNVLYHLGLDLITIATLFYIIDIQKKDNIFFRMLKFYGSCSLTLFIIEYAFIPLFIRQSPAGLFLIYVWPFIGFLGILLFIWNTYWGGVGTLEWLMGMSMGAGKKKE